MYSLNFTLKVGMVGIFELSTVLIEIYGNKISLIVSIIICTLMFKFMQQSSCLVISKSNNQWFLTILIKYGVAKLSQFDWSIFNLGMSYSGKVQILTFFRQMCICKDFLPTWSIQLGSTIAGQKIFCFNCSLNFTLEMEIDSIFDLSQVFTEIYGMKIGLAFKARSDLH